MEIKFRGQRVDNKEWVYGYYFKTPLTDEATNSKPEDGWFFLSGRERHCIAQGSCVYEIIPETVGQCTDLKDKNDKKIYESDIVKFYTFNYNNAYPNSKKPVSELHSIVFSRGKFELSGYVSYSSVLTDNYRKCKEFEVIGNIYENPELLGIEE